MLVFEIYHLSISLTMEAHVNDHFPKFSGHPSPENRVSREKEPYFGVLVERTIEPVRFIPMKNLEF